MPDIEQISQDSERVKSMIYTLAHGPYALRQQANRATEMIDALATDYHNGDLPPVVEDWWEANYQKARDARDKLQDMADTFDNDFPEFASRPPE